MSAPESSFARRVFMVRPARFEANAETAASNVFQGAASGSAQELLARARAEWDALRAGLEAAGVEVLAVEDRDDDPTSPDACFPNNWFSTHADGRLVLHPMESPVRRREARPEWVERIRAACGTREVLDLRRYEARGLFLEGTGSLILDRERRVAFAALSSRTAPEPLAELCAALSYRAVTYRTELGGAPIYHTNVQLALGPDLALVGLDAVPDRAERELLARELEATGRELLPLSESDLRAFCGNALHLVAADGTGVWALSARAADALGPRLARLERGARLVAPPVPTIEDVGGGGVRCMLGELFGRRG